jgi:3-hydroxymyristoyl/3-hydroxydecanoyl-(acyl carrier protein) dehydratase
MPATENILSFIPQRPPFVMIDRVLASSGNITRTAFLVNADNIFTEDGYFKEPGLVENIAQTAAARAGFTAKEENKPVLVGYIGAIKNLEIFFFPKTGDELVTEITIDNQIFDVSLISGKITSNNRIVARCEMKIFINQPKNITS